MSYLNRSGVFSVSMRLSELVQRFNVSRMQDFLFHFFLGGKVKKIKLTAVSVTDI